MSRLTIAPNGRYFVTSDGKPFFWLGDTGWLLFSKLNRKEALQYLDDRQKKGFNVIQAMLLHKTSVVNAYGDAALINKDVSKPAVTKGAGNSDSIAYDYWDHVDYIIDAAAQRNMYVALVPVWGSEVKEGHVTTQQAIAYATFLAERYRSRDNIIWMNGGDIKGSDSTEVWNAIGTTLHQKDGNHLITFHPRGRTQSSTWFQQADWLQFNCFQSGHRRYNQDTSAGELHYGEDNWKYVQVDFNKQPVRPTLDAEPSYEDIPQGLHDSAELRWKDSDIRRYAYWSVFAGSAGFTYGDNAVIQMHRPGDTDANYGVNKSWQVALNDPGSAQLVHLKNLLLSKPYFERLPAPALLAGDTGTHYNRLVATRGSHYAFIYTYTGRNIPVDGKQTAILGFPKARWYNPRTGSYSSPVEGTWNNTIETFDPPGKPAAGNDWVLVLEWDTWAPVYLFTSFHEPATEGLRLLFSYDGYTWSDINKTLLKPEVGSKVMRDPSIVQGPDGTFHLVWTSGWNKDRGFGYSHSKDLVHWSPQQFILVMEYDTSTVNVWAPELFFDIKTKKYLIIWASTIPYKFPKGQEEERNNHRLYYTTTTDFIHFTPTKLYYDPVFSVIDAQLVATGTTGLAYALIMKDNTRPNRNLRVAFADKLEGPFYRAMEPFTGSFTEGPAAVRLEQGWWLIYYDAYQQKKYGAVKTYDLVRFTDVSNEISVPEGHKHGTIIQTNSAVLAALLK